MSPGSASHRAWTSRRSIEALVLRARDGDAEATEVLFARYRPYLRVVCTLRVPQFCRKREDESDIVQQTLIDALRGIGGFRGETEGEFEAWMAKLLERNILQSVRRNTAEKRDIRREATAWNPGDSAQLVWHSLAGGDSSPESRVFRGEAALELAQALEQLPEDQRVAVELRYLGQRPLREIAEQIGKTTGAVAGLIARGIEHLRELLPGVGEE
jgi:RNA polymerase sigma-70 factor (ECF subfamily)